MTSVPRKRACKYVLLAAITIGDFGALAVCGLQLSFSSDSTNQCCPRMQGLAHLAASKPARTPRDALMQLAEHLLRHNPVRPRIILPEAPLEVCNASAVEGGLLLEAAEQARKVIAVFEK